MNNLIKRSYQSIVQRGLITPETTTKDFMKKLNEEYKETKAEFTKGIFIGRQSDPFYHELVDMVNVALNLLEHHKIDFVKLYEEIIEKNEKRSRFIK